MIASVIFRHDVLRRLPKIMGVTIALASVVFGFVSYLGALNQLTGAWHDWILTILQVVIFINATILLMTPEAGQRCRVWELSLPVKGYLWWQGHYLSLLLGGASLIVVYSIFPLLPFLLGNKLQDPLYPSLASDGVTYLWHVFGLPFLVYVLTLDIIALWFPASAHPGQEKGWFLRLGILIPLLTGLLILVSRFELTFFLIFILGLMGLLHSRVRIPETLSLARKHSESAESEKWNPHEMAGQAPLILHFTIMKMLFKWPVNWLLLLPFIGFFGMLLGGFNPITDDPESMRFSNFFMCIYVMLAGAGHFTEKLHQLDFLPINRRTILGWLVWPATLFLLLGYGLGQWQASGQYASAEVISFVNDEPGFGLKVPPISFQVVRAHEAPFIMADWGESHQTESAPVIKGLPWILYKPYTTPEGSSVQFVAWQISRAVKVVYGENLTPAEITDRYLETDESGRVQVCARGLSFQEDHPQWKILPSGPVFPLLFGSAVVLYLLILALLFRSLRWQASIKKTRMVFWIMMITLLVLHIGGLGTYIAGLTDDWILRGFFIGFVQRWWQTGSAAVGIAYGGLVLALVFVWSITLNQFRRLEPPRG